MAQNYKIGQAVTDVTTGYYVVVGTFNSNTTGPVYYDNGQTPKYRLDRAKTITANSTLTDGNYVWYVENNGTTITLKNVQDDVYFVKDNARNQNFSGTETANLYLDKVAEDANDKRYYLHLEDQNIGYIHCNQPEGNPCLSYWNASGESGTCVRFEFYAVDRDNYTPNYTGNKTTTGRMVGTISVGNDTYTMPAHSTDVPRKSYTDLTDTKTFTVQAGSNVALAMTQSAGHWMNAFVYVDIDNNGFTAGIAGDNYTPTGDLVSYSFYNQGYSDDNNGRNSAGTSITGDNRNTLTLPNWTVPTDLTPGEYRIRFKYDWCNIDPAGATSNYFSNSFTGHGGEIIDFTLIVEESAANSEAKAELKAAIEELDAFLASIPLGNCITQYSSSIDSPEAQIEVIRNFYNAINSETTIESIEECTAAVREIKESYKENVLEDGKFYHIRSVAYENGYVYASVTDKNPSDDRNECNGICWEATATPSNAAIWKCEIIDGVTYFKSVYTASYMSGLLQYCPGILSETEKAPITLTALGDGQVNFKINGEQAHAQTGNDQFFFVPWDGGKNTASAWYVEEATDGVQPHVLTVGAAGYATLMLGYNTVIPAIEGDDCGVFTATIEGEYAVLKEIEGVLPANTAVIVKAAKGEYAFAYTTETATVENNVLRGTLYDKNITEAAYVLGIVDDVVGLYTAAYNVSTDKTNDGTEEAPMVTYEAWKNNAFKAYLPKTAGMNAASYSFRFGEGTTGISEVKGENGEVKAIFDLTGRRVEIAERGIYIINGKKVLVK